MALSNDRSDMANEPTRRWIPVTATMVLAAALLITAILNHTKFWEDHGDGGAATTTTSLQTTTAATAASMSLQTTGAALSSSDYNSSLGLRLTLSIGQNTIQEPRHLDERLSGQHHRHTKQPDLIHHGSQRQPWAMQQASSRSRDIPGATTLSATCPMSSHWTIFGPGPIDCGALGLTPYFSFAPSSDNVTWFTPSSADPLRLKGTSRKPMGAWSPGGTGQTSRSFPTPLRRSTRLSRRSLRASTR